MLMVVVKISLWPTHIPPARMAETSSLVMMNTPLNLFLYLPWHSNPTKAIRAEPQIQTGSFTVRSCPDNSVETSNQGNVLVRGLLYGQMVKMLVFSIFNIRVTDTDQSSFLCHQRPWEGSSISWEGKEEEIPTSLSETETGIHSFCGLGWWIDRSAGKEYYEATLTTSCCI